MTHLSHSYVIFFFFFSAFNDKEMLYVFFLLWNELLTNFTYPGEQKYCFSFSSSVLSYFILSTFNPVICKKKKIPCHSVLSVSLCRQAILVKSLLEYSQSSESSVWYGLSLAAGLFLMELIRSWSLGLMWGVNYRTAARLRGAALTLAFHKILRLRSTKDISPGEVGGVTLEGTPLHIKKSALAAGHHMQMIEMDLISALTPVLLSFRQIP